MRKKLALLLATVSTLTLLASPFATASASPNVSDAEVAQQAGESYIAQRTAIFSQWAGASLANPETLYDLQNRVIAYQFTIIKDNQPIGSAVVGSSLYNHVVMQAGSSLPPELPSSSEVALAAQKTTGVQADPNEIRLERLLYLGYSTIEAIYTLQTGSIAFDLGRRQAVQVSELKSQMASPEQYAATRASAASTLTAYNNLPVPIQNDGDPSITSPYNQNNCGPTAGAMIDEYYKQSRSYSAFDDWWTDEKYLYIDMYTNQNITGGTWPNDWGPGFVAYASSKGYSFGTFWVQAPMYGDYSAIMSYIDAQEPIGLLFWSTGDKYSWHYVAVRGYWSDDSGEDLIINDGWGSTDIVSWDVYYGAVSLHFLYPN